MKSEGKCCRFDGVYSPQNYLYAVTGEWPHLYGTDIPSIIEEIEEILADRFPNNELWSYEMTELEHIVKDGLNVVLVQIDGAVGPDNDLMDTVYRWFEVPDDFTPEIDLDLNVIGVFNET